MVCRSYVINIICPGPPGCLPYIIYTTFLYHKHNTPMASGGQILYHKHSMYMVTNATITTCQCSVLVRHRSCGQTTVNRSEVSL